MTFKEGDKVKVKKSVKEPRYEWATGMTHKSVLIVLYVCGSMVRVSGDCFSDWGIHMSELELVHDINRKINRGKT